MNSLPTREDSRRRLQEAHRAEAVALTRTTKAYAARGRVQERVDAADQTIAEAVAKLAEVSGVDRAAQLLDQYIGAGRVVEAPHTRDVFKVVSLKSYIAGGVAGIRHIA